MAECEKKKRFSEDAIILDNCLSRERTFVGKGDS
jgi:hypothetical protein